MVVNYFCGYEGNASIYANGTFFSDVCFHDTGLSLLPLVYALVICVPYLVYLVKRKGPMVTVSMQPRNTRPIHLTKLILAAFYIVLQVCESLFVTRLIFVDNNPNEPAFFRLGVFTTVGLIIVIVAFVEMRQKTAISTCLFVAWLLVLVVNSLRLGIAIDQEWYMNLPDSIYFGFSIGSVVTALIQAILYGFVAPTPERPQGEKGESALPLTTPEEQLEENPPSPEANISVVSMLTYWWMNSFVIKGWRRPIQAKGIYQLPVSEQAQNLSPIFSEAWRQGGTKVLRVHVEETPTEGTSNLLGNKGESRQSQPEKSRPAGRVIGALMRSFGSLFFLSGLIRLGQESALLMGPITMILLTGYIKEYTSRPVWQGYALAVMLFVFGALQASLLQRYFYYMVVVSLRFRAALSTAIYEKILRLSQSARKLVSCGEAVNLVASDATVLLMMTAFLHALWSLPLQIAAIIFLLWYTLGVATFAGLGITILTMLFAGVIARLTKRMQLAKLKKKDERMKLTTEVLSNIKTVKVYAWEEAMQAKIEKVREEEMSLLIKAIVLNLVAQYSWFAAPVVVSIVTFGLYINLDPEANLDPSQAFVALVLFNMLRLALLQLPLVISHLVQVLVSYKRIGTFLLHDEVDADAFDQREKHSASSAAVRIRSADFTWQSSSQESALTNVNLTIKRGQLVAVIGETGCGKSSLLSAILGEMVKTRGSVSLFGKVAYVPQTSWILNGTVKDNILFSSKYDESFYRQVIDACALVPDLDIFPGGDMCEIGDKGSNLSGGQKQRISLARAIYSRSDVYLLDDSLSAVDSYTAHHLFDRVIGPRGLLASTTTRIWVTHKVSFVTKCDHIVFMANGKIAAQGSFDHLIATCPPFADLARQHVSGSSRRTSAAEEGHRHSELHKRSLTTAKKPGSEKLVEAEKVPEGAVPLGVYGLYLKAMGIGFVIFFVIFTYASHGMGVAAQNWLSLWTNEVALNATAALPHKYDNFRTYVLLSSFQPVSAFIATIMLGICSLRAAKSLHSKLLKNLMKTAIQFYETTPVSRILNRFSKDMDTIDMLLLDFIVKFSAAVCYVTATYIVIAIKVPFFLIVGIPLLALAVLLQRFFAASIRQLKRIELASLSPITQLLSESFMGATSIRAYARQDDFCSKFAKLLDASHTAYYGSQMTVGWLMVRAEFIGVTIVTVTSIVGVAQRESLDPSAVGLALAYAMSVGFVLFWLIQHAANLEANVVSVERINEYMSAPKEQPWVLPDVDNSPEMQHWPQEGGVLFENVTFRYRDGLDPALRNLTFSIRPREKIGVVGRTGAGKSSLGVVLLRISDVTAGKISIDGVDITSVGLHKLRNAVTPIPQDPVLFTGTLRSNLDPFHLRSDAAIKKCLGMLQLSQLVESNPDGLEMQISEGGENISAGQRQLICLARALLRQPSDSTPNGSNTQILLMDEATAAIDGETDKFISEMIRCEFDTTVITIAHRLETVMSYDRILVLANGQIVEFDSPAYLLSDKSSYFHSLAKSAGLVGDDK